MQHPETILIVDFGSQVTQLIARRVREAGVYSEVAPFQSADAAFDRLRPAGIILSGGPASVTAQDSPRAPQRFFEAGIPVLGICYGQQLMGAQLGGDVIVSGDGGEFGEAYVDVERDCALFDGLWRPGERHQVWMSHGDKVDAIPPGFVPVATSPGAPYAVVADEARRFYGVQFHPEVVHTPDGGRLIANFARHVCGLSGDWTMAEFRERQDRGDPGAGRDRPGDLRPVGRRRLGGRGGADPRGGGRPAHLRLRRPRPAARRRGGRGRRAVPRPLQHPARPL